MSVTLAVRAIIIYKNKILLVKHKGSSFYSLPGGKLEDNEDLKTALKRELLEELEINAEVGELAYVNEFKYKGVKTSIEFFFYIQNAQDFFNSMKNFEIKELDEVSWIDINTKDLDVMPRFLQKDLAQLDSENTESVKYFSVV